jgi:hypothetical protein
MAINRSKHDTTELLSMVSTLDVEEKAQAKDERSKGAEGQTSTNIVHQRHSRDKSKGKAKQNQNNNKTKQTTTFKKKNNNKEDVGCFVCRYPEHWTKKCPNHKG